MARNWDISKLPRNPVKQKKQRKERKEKGRMILYASEEKLLRSKYWTKCECVAAVACRGQVRGM